MVGSMRASSGDASNRYSGCVSYELIDRARAGDEDRHACLAAATGATHLLPGRRDRARVTGQDRRIQAADVDAQLERIRRHHAEDLAAAQPGLDIAPLRGQVAAAVAANSLERATSFAEGLAQAGQQQLDRDACLGEHDRLPSGAQERRAPPCATGRAAPA